MGVVPAEKACEESARAIRSLVVPWAFSPRTSSVGNAGTHCSTTSEFSGNDNILSILEGPCSRNDGPPAFAGVPNE